MGGTEVMGGWGSGGAGGVREADFSFYMPFLWASWRFTPRPNAR